MITFEEESVQELCGKNLKNRNKLKLDQVRMFLMRGDKGEGKNSNLL